MSKRQFSFRAMNTDVMIWLEANQGVSSKQIVGLFEDTRALFEQVEQTCSRFLPESELVQLNGMPGREVPVSPLLYEVLEAAHDAYLETDGIFHPGLLVPLENAGYDRSMDLLRGSDCTSNDAKAQEKQWEPQLEVPFMLNRARKTVYLHPWRKIDLGGIAKGWTVDRAAKYLGQMGNGFVNAGGDLRVFGNGQTTWNIGVEDPFSPKHDVEVLSVKSGAVATSTTAKRRWKQGSEWRSHLLDPRTGRSTTSDILQSTVTAPT
ncbi:MAG: FAD:protein FMN transferase, partial [Tumebacillaceae bacterium]